MNRSRETMITDSDDEWMDDQCLGEEDMGHFFEMQRHHTDVFFANISHRDAATLASELIYARSSGVFFSGLGKSGFVARKMANTLTAMGFPRASFLCPVNAMRGDICAIGNCDCVVIISKCGASNELLRLVPLLRQKGALVLSITSVKNNALAGLADDNFHLPLQRELFSFGLAPITSASIQMLFLDTIALAIAVTTGYGKNHCPPKRPCNEISRSIASNVNLNKRSPSNSYNCPPEGSTKSTSRTKVRSRSDRKTC